MLGKVEFDAAIRALTDIPYFSLLSRPELEQLALSLVPRRFQPGQIIFHMGDPGGLLYIIKRGKVKIYFPNTSGQEIVLDIFGESTTFGDLALFDDAPRSATIEALQETEAYTLGRTEFLGYIRSNPEFAIAIMAKLAQTIRQMNEQFSDVFAVLLPGRLARKLLSLAESHGKVTANGILIPLSLTQTDLAQMTGSTRVSINKAIKHFRNEGWISVSKGRRITIHDPDALRYQIIASGG